MKSSRMVVAVVAACGVVLVVSCASDHSAEQAAGRSFMPADGRTPMVMRQKLARAHDILDAVTIENYAVIEQSANSLTLLSEKSDWHLHDTVAYTALSDDFRRATRALAEHARQRDRTRVSDAYISMMSECLACHRYLRDEGLYRDMPGRFSLEVTDGDATAVRVARRDEAVFRKSS